MAKVYETGNKNYVIRMACRHAIDDRESMIDGYRNRFYDPKGDPNDPVTNHEFLHGNEEYINKCKAEVRDYKKMLQRTYP